MLNSNIGEYLKKNGQVLAAPMGSSMRPLLKGDECQVLLEYPYEWPKRFDVVLYRTENERLVLHRVIGIRKQEFLICGDNTYHFERGIKRENILGIMKGFYYKEHYISCENIAYRFFVYVWWLLYPLRKAVVESGRFFLKYFRKRH